MYLGDNLRRDGIVDLVETFRRTGPDALVLLTEVEDPSSYGVAELAGERIVRLVEKPKEP
ncbi:MAG: sugar phosphate nucleotidyltransferase, partial [Solirubrobacterales bacterium]